MEEYIETALAAGHIRPSTSPARGKFFLRGKERWRPTAVGLNRGLNAITVPYPYFLPLVPAALEQLRGARIFTKLDLRSAYNLARVFARGMNGRQRFIQLMVTINTELCLSVSPTPPAVFQALINGVFHDLLGRWVIAYIDDILVYSNSPEEHVRHALRGAIPVAAASSVREVRKV
ncbi:hypothetical protein QTP86_000696 [Hemibagrus guttatus]|nr:hypothetical protein QTP86_000696 [Hemibagrus guttatus]